MYVHAGMLHKIRTVCRYVLWVLIGMALAMLLLGLMRFNFNISNYIGYLNAVDASTVSFSNPSSIVDIFVPGQEKIEEVQWEGTMMIETGSLLNIQTWSMTTGDAEFADFFADFDEADFAALDANASFGFSGDIETTPTSWEELPTIQTVLTDEQKQILLQRLQSRKDRELTPSQVMTGEDDR